MTAEPTEIRIPVPWGHIAGKTWGNHQSGSHPVLALHGSFDNAATFDHLIPLLPQHQFFYVCIDLPGHGLSSHKPAGLPYYFTDFLTNVVHVFHFFGWNQATLIGHSYGGFVCAYFAACYCILSL